MPAARPRKSTSSPYPPASTTPAFLRAGSWSVVFSTATRPASSTATSSLSRPNSSGMLCAAAAISRMTVSMVPSTGSLTAR